MSNMIQPLGDFHYVLIYHDSEFGKMKASWVCWTFKVHITWSYGSTLNLSNLPEVQTCTHLLHCKSYNCVFLSHYTRFKGALKVYCFLYIWTKKLDNPPRHLWKQLIHKSYERVITFVRWIQGMVENHFKCSQHYFYCYCYILLYSICAH